MRWVLLVIMLIGLPVLACGRDRKINPRDGLAYIWIDPGTFVMGCPSECFSWEDAPHSVTLREGYWIGETEVTQKAYQRVMGSNPSRYRGALRPVEQVGFDEAKHYCEAVGMRLSTEAEWEFAARGGNSSPRYGELGAIAWSYVDSGDQTHEVAQKAPNSYGLFDVIGNLWEWVDGQRPDGKRLLRGGAFVNIARDLKVSNRLWATADTRHRDTGIRCAGSLADR